MSVDTSWALDASGGIVPQSRQGSPPFTFPPTPQPTATLCKNGVIMPGAWGLCSGEVLLSGDCYPRLGGWGAKGETPST
jgi:hypothetical protein